MSLEAPNLDDRTFKQLSEEAVEFIRSRCPEWSDLNPGDPGVTLLEAFAFVTENMIHRLNRLPEKAYVEFLNLMGVKRRPPTAASVSLRFDVSSPAAADLHIPEETLVVAAETGEGGEPVVFVTDRNVRIPPGDTAVEVLAHHCELCCESVGQGTGLPGQSVRVQRPPIIEKLEDGLDHFVGVEVTEAERAALPSGTPMREYEGRPYRIWEEASLAEMRTARHGYSIDRASGRIAFIAEPPPEGREIRVWYRRGGGEWGNVSAGTINRARSPLPPGVRVGNPLAATGGRAAETLRSALERGPREINSLSRVVTARDYELTALRASGSISRALPYTVAEEWAHGRPGTVELVLVPRVPRVRGAGPAIRLHQLEEQQAAAAEQCELVRRTLSTRQPLGTSCDVRWARYKEVTVHARVVAHRAESREDLQRRLYAALERLINPLPDEGDGGLPGWRFGESLRGFHVHSLAQREPGVKYVEDVKLIVTHAPERDMHAIVPDAHQRRTWFSGGRGELYRTRNAGEGWERIWHADGMVVERIAIHRARPGHVAILAVEPESGRSEIHVSRNCGESFRVALERQNRVQDIAWMPGANDARLMIAGDAGLHSLEDEEGAALLEVRLDEKRDVMDLHAVATGLDADGNEYVAVAAQKLRGVFLSSQAGRSNSFRELAGLRCKEVRSLVIHQQPAQTYLFAASHPSRSNEMGFAVQSWQLRGDADPAAGWRDHSRGWDSGSCHGLAFRGNRVHAASGSGGVMTLEDHENAAASWARSSLNSGLPISADRATLDRIRGVGVDPRTGQLMVCHDAGVQAQEPDGVSYRSCCSTEADDEVTLARSWLFCSGDHRLTVEYEDELD